MSDESLPNWRVLESRITFQDRWLTVRSDRCVTARGTLIDSYHVLHYPDWVNAIALTKQGRVVLVREYRHAGGKVYLGLPSGTVEKDDATPEVTVRRELLEETGYGGGDAVFLGSYSPNPATQDNRCWAYLLIGVEKLAEPSLDPSEQIEVQLEDFKALYRGACTGEVSLQGLHLAALLLATGYLARSEDPRFAFFREIWRN